MAASTSMLKSLLVQGQSMGEATYSYLIRGLFHNVGAETVRETTHALEMKAFGRTFMFSNDKYIPTPGPANPMGVKDKLWAGSQVLMAASSIGSGFMEGGIPGALQSLIRDVGVDAAMVHHGYRGIANAGVTNYHHKGMFQTLGRYGMGTAVATGFSSVLGGGIIGAAGSLVGGSLGVRHAGKLAMIGAGYYGGKTIARGTYEILKSGNSHFQQQKQIHTAGDMAAFQTSAAYTMRARAVQSIQRSANNARSALGREASYMSGSRSFFSNYRQF